MPKVIGLTGGIATGKSTVSDYLAQKGIRIIDADLVTRKVQSKGTPGLTAIENAFGAEVINDEGELNRKRLGNIVFGDNEQLTKLVRIINPFISNEVYNQINLASNEELVVFDAPTLFENGFANMVDEIVMVTTDSRTQMTRLINRNSLDVATASKRIGSQWPLRVKQELSNYIIYNNSNLVGLYYQVDKWLEKEKNGEV
ncbi:dephospho-CoA kinase [Lentilactobacillus sp. Marseille-Q4993]|uniref:dephospho-CoA kinase n=1 Tax=Lentilactobacillus sp. Marseille-Q4993 TaxID=3039492 RepID=UPI0024BC686E|nr:dephospho-CoA kinase [Lentilactobacillus sp. Marseille-Q4993]